MTNPFVRRLANAVRLSDADCATLADLTSRVRRVKAQSVLVDEDAPFPPPMHVVLEGWACGYKMVSDGGRQVTDILVPGDACRPSAPAITHSDHAFSALTNCTIAEISSTELADAFKRRPTLQPALQWSELPVDSLLREALTNNNRRRASQRIAHLICELRARLTAVGLVDDETFAWPLTQEDVADTTGLTSVHVNRTFRDLRNAGLIGLKARRMRILDAERLAEYCDFRPSYLHLGSSSATIKSRPEG